MRVLARTPEHFEWHEFANHELPDSVTKIVALESVARAWTAAGLSWAVTNGLENYPDGVGRDLDVLVEQGGLKRAVQVVVDVLVPMDWIVLPNLQGWIWWIVAFRKQKDGRIDSLQIDLFEHLQWAFTWVVRKVGEDGPLIERGPFREDPGAAVAKKFILNGLSSGTRAFRKKPGYLNFTNPERDALPRVLERVSGRDWPDLIQATEEKRLDSLDACFASFRKASFRHAIWTPRKIARLASGFQKQWVVNIAPRQGAPVIEIRMTDEFRAQEIVQVFVRELESLIFHRIDVISGEQGRQSARSLRRLSCLQVVLIFLNSPVSSGLAADLVVSDGKKGEFCTLSYEGGEMDCSESSSHREVRRSLLKVFETKSADLLKKAALKTSG